MTITERIFVALAQKKLSQKEFAERIEVNEKTVSAWKKNNSLPPSDKISKISDCLDMTVDYLLTGKENQTAILTTDEQALLDNYRQLADASKKELSSKAEELANGVASETNENRQGVFKPVYYSDLREKEMLMLFRSLSEHEQAKLIGRAELLVEQDEFKKNIG